MSASPKQTGYLRSRSRNAARHRVRAPVPPPGFTSFWRPIPQNPLPGRGFGDALDDDIDIIPMGQAGTDGASAGWIIAAEIVHRLVGEDDAPAKGVAGLVALIDIDDAIGIAQFHRDREIEAGGAAANTGNFHGLRPFQMGLR